MPRLIGPLPVVLASGQHQWEANIPGSTAMRVRAVIARNTPATPTTWPDPSTRVDMTVWLALGPGQPFEFWFGVGGFGGQVGSPVAPEMWVRRAISAGGGRRLRIEVVVTNGPLISSLTLVSE